MFVVRTQACLLICKSSWILLRVVLFFFCGDPTALTRVDHAGERGYGWGRGRIKMR